MPFKRYPGENVTVLYDVKRCIHAAECVHGLPTVFDPEKRPWIQPANTACGDIEQVVARCPSGALRIQGQEPAAGEPEARNSVLVSRDGPLYLRGRLEISVGGESPQRETRLALCRCGASRNKPFCDNQHLETGFQAPGSVEAGGEEAEPGKDLSVMPAPNGPLLIRGDFEMSGSESEGTFRGQKAALCRCGASKNKPFCDGRHKVIGFVAE